MNDQKLLAEFMMRAGDLIMKSQTEAFIHGESALMMVLENDEVALKIVPREEIYKDGE